MRPRLLAATATATLVLAACGDGGTPEEAAPDDRTDEALEDTQGAVDDGEPVDDPAQTEPTVTLIDAGEDPQELRFAFEPGTSTGTFTFAFTQTALEIDGQSGPAQPALPIEVDAEVEVVEVDDDGTAEVRFTYRDPRVGADADLDDEDRETVQQQLAILEDIAGTFRIDDRARITEASVDADPASGLDQIGEQFTALAVPVPDEPVGVGGSWSVTQLAEVSGITTEQVITVTLVERDGDELTLEFETAGTSPSGPIDLPEIPGAQAEIVSSEVRGTGTNVLLLSRPLPLATETSAQAEQELRITEGETTSTLTQAFTIDARYEDAG